MEAVAIKKITKLDKVYDRYDLTVSSTNNFFANGILIHNTSFICSNVKVKNYFKLPLHKRLWNWFCDTFTSLEKYRITDYVIDYGNVYSSRSVIKNKTYNPEAKEGFYGADGDVWAWINGLIKDYIPNGMTVYGEAYGYLPNSDKMIQKDYDYGCKVGETKIMPYRITTENEEGVKREWNVSEVQEWTLKLIEEHPELKDIVEPIDILYHGTLADLYPELDTKEHWHENVLNAMANDKEHFGMEKNEPKCKFHKTPREGVVLRKMDDPVAEAFKLKCEKFLGKERLAIDNGEVDMEMDENGAEE